MGPPNHQDPPARSSLDDVRPMQEAIEEIRRGPTYEDSHEIKPTGQSEKIPRGATNLSGRTGLLRIGRDNPSWPFFRHELETSPQFYVQEHQEPICCVCREEWGPRTEPLLLECDHFICRACALDWFKPSLAAGAGLQETNACPTCRRKVSVQEEDAQDDFYRGTGYVDDDESNDYDFEYLEQLDRWIYIEDAERANALFCRRSTFSDYLQRMEERFNQGRLTQRTRWAGTMISRLPYTGALCLVPISSIQRHIATKLLIQIWETRWKRIAETYALRRMNEPSALLDPMAAWLFRRVVEGLDELSIAEALMTTDLELYFLRYVQEAATHAIPDRSRELLSYMICTVTDVLYLWRLWFGTWSPTTESEIRYAVRTLQDAHATLSDYVGPPPFFQMIRTQRLAEQGQDVLSRATLAPNGQSAQQSAIRDWQGDSVLFLQDHCFEGYIGRLFLHFVSRRLPGSIEWSYPSFGHLLHGPDMYDGPISAREADLAIKALTHMWRRRWNHAAAEIEMVSGVVKQPSLLLHPVMGWLFLQLLNILVDIRWAGGSWGWGRTLNDFECRVMRIVMAQRSEIYADEPTEDVVWLWAQMILSATDLVWLHRNLPERLIYLDPDEPDVLVLLKLDHHKYASETMSPEVLQTRFGGVRRLWQEATQKACM